MAWVGDFIFSCGQAYVAGFCVNCPESAETVHADLREIGPTYFFAPPRVFEGLLTSVTIRMEDAEPRQAPAVRAFHAARAPRRRRRSSTAAGRRARTAWPTRSASCWSTGRSSNTLGPDAHPRRLHRRRGDRAGHLRVLPRARHQPEAALRPDRGVRLRHRSSRTARCGPTPSACPRPASSCASTTAARCSIARRRVRRILQAAGEHGRDQGRRGLGRDRRCRLHRAATGI